jgi:hypothetical protein
MRYSEAVKEHGSIREAARKADIPYATFHYNLKKEQQSSALNKLGLKIEDAESAIIDDLGISGTSRYYKLEDGGIWVKASKEVQRQRHALETAAQELQKDLRRAKPVQQPKATNEDLASCYILTDYHLGQLSWPEETGDDWDLEIAEELLIKWFAAAIQSAPDSSTGVLCQLGDFMHWDSHSPVTPTSGHILDASTRFQEVVRVGISSLRHVIDLMLKKHEHVHVIMAEGNHDLSSSVWLKELFSMHYEDEPRVTVDNNPTPYHCFEWGNTSLFFHHGHKKKLSDISKTFAGNYRDVFGRTKYSYAHMGHLHHRDLKEDQLMEVEQHQTLAPKDAYSARGGYGSKRGARVITYSKRFGYAGEVNITPEMIR